MRNRLKAVGVAFVASLALSAVAVTAASANGTMHYYAPDAPTVGTGFQSAPHVFKTTAGEISCANSTFAGTAGIAVSTTLTATASYSNCVAFGFASTHIKMNKCHFLFTTPTERVSAGHYTGNSPHVVGCESGKGVEVTPTDPFFGFSVCTVTIPAQTPTSGDVTAKNEGAEATRDVFVTSNVKGIHYTVDGGGGLCGATGTTHSNGEYIGSVTLKGFDDNNSNVDNSHSGAHEAIEITGS